MYRKIVIIHLGIMPELICGAAAPQDLSILLPEFILISVRTAGFC